jgi:hypothetical protein
VLVDQFGGALGGGFVGPARRIAAGEASQAERVGAVLLPTQRVSILKNPQRLGFLRGYTLRERKGQDDQGPGTTPGRQPIRQHLLVAEAAEDFSLPILGRQGPFLGTGGQIPVFGLKALGLPAIRADPQRSLGLEAKGCLPTSHLEGKIRQLQAAGTQSPRKGETNPLTLEGGLQFQTQGLPSGGNGQVDAQGRIARIPGPPLAPALQGRAHHHRHGGTQRGYERRHVQRERPGVRLLELVDHRLQTREDPRGGIRKERLAHPRGRSRGLGSVGGQDPQTRTRGRGAGGSPHGVLSQNFEGPGMKLGLRAAGDQMFRLG